MVTLCHRSDSNARVGRQRRASTCFGVLRRASTPLERAVVDRTSEVAFDGRVLASNAASAACLALSSFSAWREAAPSIVAFYQCGRTDCDDEFAWADDPNDVTDVCGADTSFV